MNIDSHYINELIRQDENTGVEFKSARADIDTLAKEIVGFANQSGGVILLGIDDNRKVSGLDLSKKYEEWCMNIAANNVIPPIEISYNQIEYENKLIAVIHIPKGKDKPYQTNHSKFYIRIGSTNRTATVQELMRLFQQSGIFHFDATTIDNTSGKNLNQSKIVSFFNTYKINYELLSEDEKLNLLKNTDIIDENMTLTVAGLLIFGNYPQKYLLNSSVSFAHFSSSDISSTLTDKQNIEGTLDYQIVTTTAIIKNNIPRRSDIVSNKRIESENYYPDKVFRELIVNACCHRKYSITGSKIRVFLFNNRLEVISPGRLPNTVTIDKLASGVSYAINPVIVKFMENLNYIDKSGRGLPMVYQEAKSRNKKICFEEIGEEFKVTLYL
jgi:ATP-dependent DNA helicase RecG